MNPVCGGGRAERLGAVNDALKGSTGWTFEMCQLLNRHLMDSLPDKSHVLIESLGVLAFVCVV